MDQDQQEHKHVCRFCNKRFSNGKVLGGHMRCHVAKNPKKLVKKRAESLSNNSKSYGLRVNPKKSSRVSLALSDQEPSSLREIECRVCGKVFDSMRALFGHMRHHSSKRKKESCLVNSGCSDREGLIGEKLFVESSRFAKRKRSRRSRFKVSTNCSVSNFSIEFDPEVEEIAVCLLMLSKGVRKLEEFCLADDGTSPNCDIETRMIKRLRVDESSEPLVSGCVDFLEDKKLSQFSENDEEKESGSLEVSDPKVFDENVMKVMINQAVQIEADQNYLSPLGCSVPSLDNPHQKIEYKCRTCHKIFHSHQALGGHQTIHRPNKAYQALQFEDFPVIEGKFGDDTNGVEAERVNPVTSSEISKEHKCPICFKVFASGQALGGHKRAHMVKDSEVEPEQIALTSHENCGISGHVLDTDVELKSPWWVRNNHKTEFLLGLVPN